MLLSLSVRNLRRFAELAVPVSSPTLVEGPAGSGKSTIFQAFLLWDTAKKRWLERTKSRDGGSLWDSFSLPLRDVPGLAGHSARLLWRDGHTRDIQSVKETPRASNIPIEILVRGWDTSRMWTCGFRFEFASADSLTCHPVEIVDPERAGLTEAAKGIEIRRLRLPGPPIPSELVVNGDKLWEACAGPCSGVVVRSLCLAASPRWDLVKRAMERLFPATLAAPRAAAGRVNLHFEERKHLPLELACASEGFCQALAALAFLAANPGRVVLIDKPGRSLDSTRRRSLWWLLSEVARENGCQLIASSADDVLLRETAAARIWLGDIGHLATEGPATFDDLEATRKKEFLFYAKNPLVVSTLYWLSRHYGHRGADVFLTVPKYYALGAQAIRGHFDQVRLATRLGIAAAFDGPPEWGPGNSLKSVPVESILAGILLNRDLFAQLSIRAAEELGAGPFFVQPVLDQVWEEAKVEESCYLHKAQQVYQDFLNRIRIPAGLWGHPIESLISLMDPASPPAGLIEVLNSILESIHEYSAVDYADTEPEPDEDD